MKTTTFLMVLLFVGCSSGSSSSGSSSGAGAGDTTGSCDTQTINDNCEDDTGAPDVVAPYQSACTSGTWSNGPCDRTGSVGGCQTTDASVGVTITDWAFPPQTTAGVMAACEAPSTFVTP